MYIVTRILKKEQIEPIINLYKEGYSAQEIKDTLKLDITTRTIQRLVKKFGLSRSARDAWQNAIKRNRVKWAFKKDKIKRKKLSPKIRFQILRRDNFKCILCGSTNILEVDHIDGNKNNSVIDNLQTLCHECNQGKFLISSSS